MKNRLLSYAAVFALVVGMVAPGPIHSLVSKLFNNSASGLYTASITPLAESTVQYSPSSVRDALAAKGIKFGYGLSLRDPYLVPPRPANFLTILGPYFNHYSISISLNSVEAKQGVYNFSVADKSADYAKSRGVKVKGHALVWGDEGVIPAWIKDANFTPEQKEAILKDFVQKVVQHFTDKYPGLVDEWNVSNEPTCSNGNFNAKKCTPEGLALTDFWKDIRKPGSTDSTDYIQLAFQWVKEIDPNAKLYINENGIETDNSAKNDRFYNLIKHLLEKGVPIDGVGFESHIITSEAGLYSLDGLKRNFDRFADLGLDSQVTEFDVMLTSRRDTSTSPSTPIPILVPTEQDFANQANIYKMFLQACVEAKRCSEFVLWGFWDTSSWTLGHWPGDYYPHILDADFKQKQTFAALATTLGIQPIPIVVADTTSPVIALNNAADITISLGDPYTDAGATATDDTDGDLTSAIIIDNTVNTNVAGTYTVSYSVKDAANNAASAVRTVRVVAKVVDTVPSTGGGGGGTPATTTVISPVVSTPSQVFVPLPPVTIPVPPTQNLVVPTVASGFWSFLPFISSTPKPTQTITPAAPAPHANTKTGKKSYDIVNAEYSLNGIIVHTATTYPDDWSLNTATLQDGQYTLSSKFYYSDGTTDGTQSTFTVDNSPTVIEKIISYIQNLLKK